ncbi:MAG: MetQ/NlpA family ABC transporter substrate-binding protein, partial [Alkalibacterium sp.]
MKLLKKALLTVSLGFSVGLLASCGTQAAEEETVKIGVVGEDQDVWDFVIDKLDEDGISVELVNFTDYTQPNRALDDGEIDLNAFQHKLFLSSYNEDNETDLVPIGDTVIAPLGFYSEKVSAPDELEEDATVAIPND